MIDFILMQVTTPPVRASELQDLFQQITTDPLTVPPPPKIERVVPLEAYVEVLEKTNSQLGVWWTAMGVLIAALAVLFTVGAIVVTWFLFRQSREFREDLRKSLTASEESHKRAIAEYQAVLSRFVEEKNQQIKARLDHSIGEAKKQLETATGEQAEQVRRAIVQLEERRDAFVSHGVGQISGSFANVSLPVAGSLLEGDPFLKANLGLVHTDPFIPRGWGTGATWGLCEKCQAALPKPTQYGIENDQPAQWSVCLHCGHRQAVELFGTKV